MINIKLDNLAIAVSMHIKRKKEKKQFMHEIVLHFVETFMTLEFLTYINEI